MGTKEIKPSDIRLSCNALKIIACIFMFIDHFGYGVVHNYMITHAMDIAPETYTRLNTFYEVCRGIGRLAFPIFAFFLVEGFIQTHNVVKYAVRLGLFALISEIPFDIGLYCGNWKYIEHQNIIATFFIALIMLIVIRFLEQNTAGLSRPVVVLSIICAVIAFADAAYLLKTDYSWKCMLVVAVLYLFRECGAFRLLAGASVVSWQKFAPVSFLLLYFYDPEVRPRFKYAFYVFYPLHLLVIYVIARIII